MSVDVTVVKVTHEEMQSFHNQLMDMGKNSGKTPMEWLAVMQASIKFLAKEIGIEVVGSDIHYVPNNKEDMQ